MYVTNSDGITWRRQTVTMQHSCGYRQLTHEATEGGGNPLYMQVASATA